MILLTQTVVKDPGVLVTHLKGMVPQLVSFGLEVVAAVFIYLIGVKVIKLIRKLFRRGMDRTDMEEGAKQFLDSFAKFALYFLLIVLIGTKFGVTTASVVALLGSAGLAVGLALQGSLSNFAGGVLILLLKPFSVGDYIITESGKEGTVTEIQIFYTRLTTADNKLIVIPNGKLSDGVVTNVSKLETRRVDLSIRVPYQSNLKEVRELMEELIWKETQRVPEMPPEVFVDQLQESSILIACRVWVKTENYWEVKWRLTEQLKELMDKNGIEIPFPQIDVNIQQ
ncbi:MAG: mechanosensitive ion channel [Lachnospiraceae bacterium]